MVTRVWEFTGEEVVVPETQIEAVRQRIVDLLPTTFCSDDRFRSDGYDSLVKCVMDAIGSVGVKYTTVINCLRKFEDHCQREGIGPVNTPAEFLNVFAPHLSDGAWLATNLWNRQRTSTSSGILKIEAMVRWFVILDRHGIQTPQQLVAQVANPLLKQELLAVPGQSEFVSLIYFFMLANYRDGVKDDRMIARWFETTCGLFISTAHKAVILMEVAELLHDQYPCLTAAELDHLIWLVQSDRWSPERGFH
jgi:hypothetical protein